MMNITLLIVMAFLLAIIILVQTFFIFYWILYTYNKEIDVFVDYVMNKMDEFIFLVISGMNTLFERVCYDK